MPHFTIKDIRSYLEIIARAYGDDLPLWVASAKCRSRDASLQPSPLIAMRLEMIADVPAVLLVGDGMERGGPTDVLRCAGDVAYALPQHEPDDQQAVCSYCDEADCHGGVSAHTGRHPVVERAPRKYRVRQEPFPPMTPTPARRGAPRGWASSARCVVCGCTGGCTESVAYSHDCWWVSLDPPLCSRCG